MLRSFDSLISLFEAFPDEQSCIDHLRAIRWADGAFCPYCGGTKVYDFSDKRTHKCGDCRQRFSIKVGTIFQDTKLPLRKWFIAIWMITSHKNGIASTQLAKDLKVTQKTAWFVLHRLRFAARTRSFNMPLTGDVEVDETAVGGLERNKHEAKRLHRGTGPIGKAVVMGMLERGGELRAEVIQRATGPIVHPIVRRNVAPGANLFTDEAMVYRGLADAYRHYRVSHSTGEYVRGGFAHTNSIESVWALLKRQIIGVHHWVSPKHLHRYVTGMAWRFNRRELGEGVRVNALLGCVEGRLTYKALIA